VIWGLTNHGKSHILRAIDLLRKNRPLGPGFWPKHNKKGGDTIIELGTNEGSIQLVKTVSVSKAGSIAVKNTKYVIETESGAESFDVIGNGPVPDKVSEFLKMIDLNIQDQLDNGIVLDIPRLSAEINRITDAETCMSWISDLNSAVNTRNRSIKFLETEIKDDEEKLDRLEGLNDLSEKIDELSRLERKVEIKKQKRKEASRILFAFREAKRKVDAFDIIGDTDELSRRITVHLNRVKDLEAIARKIKKAIASKRKIESARKALKSYKTMKGLLDNIEGFYSKLGLVENAIQIKKELQTKDKILEETERETMDLFEDLEICPLCLQKIDISKIEEHVRS
jgi:hypothetical protein